MRMAVAVGALALATVAGALVAAPPATASPAAVRASPTPTRTPTPSPSPLKRPVGTALAVDLAPDTVLTLPAKDGLRDRATVRIRSGAAGTVNLDAVSGTATVHLATDLALRRGATDWRRSATVSVGRLTAGTWRLRAMRSTTHSIRARSVPLLVGSGVPVHVIALPAARTLYPYVDGVLDRAVVAVSATDETGTPVPVTGTVRIDAGKRHVTRRVSAGTARLPVTALPLGTATMTTTVTGPAGTAAVRRSRLLLAPTAVGSMRIARSSDTVQPVVDGLLDSVVLTTSGTASAASPAVVSGTLTVSRGGVLAASFPVPDGGQHAFTWDGRVGGAVVAGTYTVSLTLHGPQGLPRTVTTTLSVSRQHLAYRVQDLFTVAAGNQQGLAVHDGRFYVAFDNGDGTSTIRVYDATGAAIDAPQLQSLAIGHGAELSWSTTTNLLWAANGGATTPTKVWGIDPATGTLTQAFDLSALGANGMVAVDDANARLLVFAGTAGGFTVTPVSMADSTTTNTDGSTTTVPAGSLLGPSMPIGITGTPQGIEMVGQQLWVYTSLKKVNHIARFDLAGSAPVQAAAGSDATSDLMTVGEGEGLAFQSGATGSALPGWIYVGAHSVNRVGLLVPVTDQ